MCTRSGAKRGLHHNGRLTLRIPALGGGDGVGATTGYAGITSRLSNPRSTASKTLPTPNPDGEGNCLEQTDCANLR